MRRHETILILMLVIAGCVGAVSADEMKPSQFSKINTSRLSAGCIKKPTPDCLLHHAFSAVIGFHDELGLESARKKIGLAYARVGDLKPSRKFVKEYIFHGRTFYMYESLLSVLELGAETGQTKLVRAVLSKYQKFKSSVQPSRHMILYPFLAVAHFANGDAKMGKEAIERALDAARGDLSQNSVEGLVKITARYLIESGRTGLAVALSRDLDDIFKARKNMDPKNYAIGRRSSGIIEFTMRPDFEIFLSRLGQKQVASGDLDGAERTLSLFEERRRKSKLMTLIVRRLAVKQDFTTALQTSKHIRDEPYRSEAIAAIILAVSRTGDFPRARKIADFLNSITGRVAGICNMAVARTELGQIDKGVALIAKARHMSANVKEPYIRFNALFHVYRCEFLMNKVADARQTMLTAKQALDDRQDIDWVSGSFRWAAARQMELGDKIGARLSLISAVKVMKKHDGSDDIMIVFQSEIIQELAMHYLKTNKLRLAVETAITIPNASFRAMTFADIAVTLARK